MSIKKGNTSIVAVMLDSCQRFEEEIADAYNSFRKKRNESWEFCKPYREAERIFADQMKEVKTKHRGMIHRSQETVQDAIAEGALKLADELQDALCRPIPQAFLRMIEAYNSSGMKPGKTELEALGILSEDHPSALRMIDVLCERTGADMRLKHPNISEFEADISYLAKYGSLFDIPLTNMDQLDTSVALFAAKESNGYSIEPEPETINTVTKEPVPGVGDRLIPIPSETGEKMQRLKPDGTIETTEYDWDIPHLTKANLDYQELVNRLHDMADRWSGGIYPVEPVEIDEAIQLAKELGQERAAMDNAVIPDSIKQ